MTDFNTYLKHCEDTRKNVESIYPFLKNKKYFNTQEEKEWEEQDHTLAIYHFVRPDFITDENDWMNYLQRSITNDDIRYYASLTNQNNMFGWTADDTGYTTKHYLSDINKYVLLKYEFYKKRSKLSGVFIFEDRTPIN